MNAQEANVVRFLLQCREDGLDTEGIRTRVKMAVAGAATAAGGLGLMGMLGGAAKGATSGTAKAGKDLTKWLLNKGLLATVIGPPVVGGALGYGAAQLTRPEYTLDMAKKEEQIDAYRQAVADLSRVKRR